VTIGDMRLECRLAKSVAFLAILSLLLTITLSGCGRKGGQPSYRLPSGKRYVKVPRGTQRPYKIKGRTYYPLPSAIGYEEVGYASWYGPGFHGRKTANGERYDMHAMTAAHKILPMNTLVRVKNLANGREVVVRINDRGPFVKNRIIDLSYAAAKKLGVIGPGVAKVRLTALSEVSSAASSEVYYVKRPLFNVGKFYIQVGAFSSRDNALRLRGRLLGRYRDVRVVKARVDGSLYYRVQIRAPRNLKEARGLEKRLEESGFPQAFLIAD